MPEPSLVLWGHQEVVVKIVFAVLIGGLMTMGCGSHQSEERLAPTAASERRSIEMTVVAEMPPDEVFELWTTAAGSSRFFAPAA